MSPALILQGPDLRLRGRLPPRSQTTSTTTASPKLPGRLPIQRNRHLGVDRQPHTSPPRHRAPRTLDAQITSCRLAASFRVGYNTIERRVRCSPPSTGTTTPEIFQWFRNSAGYLGRAWTRRCSADDAELRRFIVLYKATPVLSLPNASQPFVWAGRERDVSFSPLHPLRGCHAGSPYPHWA